MSMGILLDGVGRDGGGLGGTEVELLEESRIQRKGLVEQRRSV